METIKPLQDPIKNIDLENENLKSQVVGKIKLKDRTSISGLLKGDEGRSYIGKIVAVAGWVRTVRGGRGDFSFIELTDGTTHSSLQVLFEKKYVGDTYEELTKQIKTGASLFCVGEIVKSLGKNQVVELVSHRIEILGICADASKYPLSKKKHTLEHLRDHLHLRPRTRIIGAVTRIRNSLAFATHRFYQERDFYYIHTPILTVSDCEGAGELFQVTTMFRDSEDDVTKIQSTKDKKVDYKKDFFRKKTYLTVSGQLNVEAFACALSNVYTFGPTFRAEESHTTRHLAEFWMVEPEIAFADLEENMDVAEAYIKYITKYILEKHPLELEFLEKFEEEVIREEGKNAPKENKTKKKKFDWRSVKLRDRLKNTVNEGFKRMTYTDAIDELVASGEEFEVTPEWGIDLGSEHERYLCETVYKKPVIIYNYPKDIKAFYMRINEDNKTVAAMDILVPGIGELVGGSQREERLDVLKKRIIDSGLDPESYDFYLDLRKYGSVPHSGFGLGFERMVRYATGMENIREVIPFPRSHGNCDF